jgi:N-acetylmuramoyl-L-alanine amidase
MKKHQRKHANKPMQRKSVRRAQRSGRSSVARAAQQLAAADSAARATDPAQNPAPSPISEVYISPHARRIFVLGVIGSGLVLLLLALFQNRGAWLRALQGPQLHLTATVQAQATAQAAHQASTLDPNKRVGIVSGHRGNDSGAVCSDGLTEAQVNFDAATRVASLLRAQGYTVDVLDEFDVRLKGYRARALLSIHADSCEYINDAATGYKVARFTHSPNPEASDRLVACVSQRYQAATGLQFHRNTVTYDMQEYHAFREINPDTPGAIIELGFLYLDHTLLTRKKDLVARALADGLLCFLEASDKH